MRSLFVLAILGVLLITVALVVRSGMIARKDPGRPISSAMRSAMDSHTLAPEELEQVERRFPGATKTDSGIYYVVKKPGEGPAPIKGQVVSVNYVGTFLDGRKFDASADHGGPFNFQVGFGRVIEGWDQICLQMKKGEARTVVVPWWLAYGEKGRGKIPPRTSLVFDLEILDIR